MRHLLEIIASTRDQSPSGDPFARARRMELGGAFAILTFAAASIALMPCAGAQPAASDPPTEAQILDALKAKRLTRCPHANPSSGCHEPLAEPAEKPIVAVEIAFAYASAIPGPAAAPALSAIGDALGKPGMTGVLLVAGHADARGGAGYNQRLSQRRAEVVKRLLIRKFKLTVDAVVAVGYGKERLKNTAAPFAAENRRVEIVNAQVK